LSTGTRSPSALDALPRRPDKLEVRITEPDKPVEGPERVVPAAVGRREAKHPLELRRRISGIGAAAGLRAEGLRRRLGVKDEAPPSAGPQFRDLACAFQGVRES
jgi:hypothetical protein